MTKQLLLEWMHTQRNKVQRTADLARVTCTIVRGYKAAMDQLLLRNNAIPISPIQIDIVIENLETIESTCRVVVDNFNDMIERLENEPVTEG